MVVEPGRACPDKAASQVGGNARARWGAPATGREPAGKAPGSGLPTIAVAGFAAWLGWHGWAELSEAA